MGLNNNIFCVTNPARIMDGLVRVMDESGVGLTDMLIFLPSRRAVRSVEKMLVDRAGGTVLLPRLVALGEGADGEIPEDDTEDMAVGTVGKMERVMAVTRVLQQAGAEVGAVNMDAAISVAHDLVRMTDYMENEGVDAAKIDWNAFVDDKYASHFKAKAKLLEIISKFLPDYAKGCITTTAARNAGIRDWIKALDKYKLVIVCGSTASVPATADLMVAVAKCAHGRIILPGRIAGRTDDFELPTNPYNSEYKFLQRVGLDASDVVAIDVGPSAIDFFNIAFGNDFSRRANASDVSHCHLVRCGRESEEAAAIAEIAVRSVRDKKSVLIITPDAAGNQRLATALAARGLGADFSGGVPGNMTDVGRAILNQFDRWIDSGNSEFERLYAESGRNLMDVIIAMVDDPAAVFTPDFSIDDAASVQIWNAISELSKYLAKLEFVLDVRDARALLADVISSVTVRGKMKDDAEVVVLGTIESRMQTADVVILSGLNDGMFPARGYDNGWLPRRVAAEIGLPSPDRKVSLMALDFMNLSCGPEVYWVRCDMSGGAEKTESRFLSRVTVAGGDYDWENKKEIPPFDVAVGCDVVATVRRADMVKEREGFDVVSYPKPPADWSDVYVTKLELLIHNPYVFYVDHILGLRKPNDYWEFPTAAEFGTLVHNGIEKCALGHNMTVDGLIETLDAAAREKVGENNIMFDFWHHRFVEFAPTVVNELKKYPDMQFEVQGSVDIYLDAEKQSKRTVRARADGVWSGGVMDIKTGAIPNNSQLTAGNMPQLPLEALILQNGGFGRTFGAVPNPQMIFLQLQRKKVGAVEKDREIKRRGGDGQMVDIINAATEKVKQLFKEYSAGGNEYKYRMTRKEDFKSHMYDDFARVDDWPDDFVGASDDDDGSDE